jgi:L-aspartate oxidase
MRRADVLVIGCGIAGATTALELAADRERQIVLLTRARDAGDCASGHAQGGVAGRGREDDAAMLAADVLAAGAGLCLPPAVRLLAEDGPREFERLLVERLGVRFDRDGQGEPQYGLEAAHSRRRILHVEDQTGAAIMAALLRELAGQPNVELLTGHTVVDLLTSPHHALDPLAVYRAAECRGAYALDQATGRVAAVVARATVLASGGLGQVFLNTTNPPGARGDGLAMAHRAGARVANVEYVQFHPTALHMPGATKFLISEAVRGEGAVLLTPDGEPFARRHAPGWSDLASRDVVARGIYGEMLRSSAQHVLLDLASHRPADFIRRRFPTIHARCLEQNVDITRQPIPVVPAAHYACGGVLVDLDGQSTLAGLFAVGEVACTGVHGANRLASTSLLEGLLWGVRAARRIRQLPRAAPTPEADVPPWDDSGSRFEADPALIQGDLQTVRNLMWHYVGLVRNEYRLDRAIRELAHLASNIEDFYRRTRLTDGLIGLRNAVQVACIVARAARRNPPSRGCHVREDSRPPRATWRAGPA